MPVDDVKMKNWITKTSHFTSPLLLLPSRPTTHVPLLLATHRTERVKSPGLDLEGRARKEPSMPRSFSSTSASRPDTLGWNHLWREGGSVLGCSRSLLPQTHVQHMNDEHPGKLIDATTSYKCYGNWAALECWLETEVNKSWIILFHLKIVQWKTLLVWFWKEGHFMFTNR